MIRKRVPIVGITGSSGKSTTKEMLSSIMETKWKVLKTSGNENLPLHIRKTMKQLNTRHQAVVLELGMGKPGAAHRHSKYMRPDIVVFTCIGTAHIGNLGNSIQSIAKNKSLLMHYIKKNGLVLTNSDDANSKWLNQKIHKGRKIAIGIHNENADYRAFEMKFQKKGTEFSLMMNRKKEKFEIRAYGYHNVYNALFAIAVAHQLGCTSSEIRRGLSKFEPPIKRLNVTELRSNSILIDDTINANPESVKAATDVLFHLGDGKRKVVVIGSMLEMGELSNQAHYLIGQYLAQKKVDTIYTYGNEAQFISEGAVEGGMDKNNIQHFISRYKLHEALLREHYNNSIILVKGSSGMKMHLTSDFIKSRNTCFVQMEARQNSNEVQIHPDTMRRLQLKSNELNLHFGKYSKSFTLKESELIPIDILQIPRKLSRDITIPDVNYESYLSENHLHLGPVIGFSVLSLYFNAPEKQHVRFSNLKRNKGLIYMFQPHSSHANSQHVIGKYYDPDKEMFIDGTFPFPTTIFNRVNFRLKTFQMYHRRIGNNIFNYPYTNTDKWLFWTVLSKDPLLKKHLPNTTRYTNVKIVQHFLRKYREVYLKPYSKAGGNGIVGIRYINKRNVFINEVGKRWIVQSTKHLETLLKQNLKKRTSYIVQQSVPSDFPMGKVDFRAYIQKDGSGTWKFTGLEAKVGRKGSIISNSKNRVGVLQGETALHEIYGLSNEQIKRKINEISSLGLRMLTKMEPLHQLLGDAAIDLVIDKNLKIWMLEVQFNYAAEIKQFRTEDERIVLPDILHTPLEYAHYLAGFSPVSENKSER